MAFVSLFTQACECLNETKGLVGFLMSLQTAGNSAASQQAKQCCQHSCNIDILLMTPHKSNVNTSVHAGLQDNKGFNYIHPTAGHHVQYRQQNCQINAIDPH